MRLFFILFYLFWLDEAVQCCLSWVNLECENVFVFVTYKEFWMKSVTFSWINKPFSFFKPFFLYRYYILKSDMFFLKILLIVLYWKNTIAWVCYSQNKVGLGMLLSSSWNLFVVYLQQMFLGSSHLLIHMWIPKWSRIVRDLQSWLLSINSILSTWQIYCVSSKIM